MQGILCNLPEIWTHLNSKHDVSDLGNVRDKETEVVLHRYKGAAGYACVCLHHVSRYIHPYVLHSFIPRPSPMFTMCDHVNRDRMDPRLINLRWSNAVLNGMNKSGVRGYAVQIRKGVKTYYVSFKILAVRYHMPQETTKWKARAAYEYWQSRAFEIIDALCSRNIHWKFQRLILEYFMPVAAGSRGTMKWETDPVFARDPQNGALTAAKRDCVSTVNSVNIPPK